MNTAPTTYAIRVHGHLDDHWSAWLGEPDMTRETTAPPPSPPRSPTKPSSTAYSPACATSAPSSPSSAPPVRPPESPVRRSSARCTPNASPSVPPPPTTPRRPGQYRDLESVNEWLTGCPADLDGYRKLFTEPARLASTVIVTLGHGAADPVIGDFMLRREDAWAQLDVAEQAHDNAGRARLDP